MVRYIKQSASCDVCACICVPTAGNNFIFIFGDLRKTFVGINQRLANHCFIAPLLGLYFDHYYLVDIKVLGKEFMCFPFLLVS